MGTTGNGLGDNHDPTLERMNRGFFGTVGTYFYDARSPGIISSKRVNGAIGLIAAIVLAFTVRDIALVCAFLGLCGVEGLATAVAKR